MPPLSSNSSDIRSLFRSAFTFRIVLMWTLRSCETGLHILWNISPLPSLVYNNNQHKRFSDLFFFLVRWMSDGMTFMNGGWWRLAGGEITVSWRWLLPSHLYTSYPAQQQMPDSIWKAITLMTAIIKYNTAEFPKKSPKHVKEKWNFFQTTWRDQLLEFVCLIQSPELFL